MSGIVWNFDKSCYSPSDIVKLSLSAINNGDSPICFSEVLFESDFGTYPLQQVSGIIPPPNSDSLASIHGICGIGNTYNSNWY
jgi:hypothetical protein